MPPWNSSTCRLPGKTNHGLAVEWSHCPGYIVVLHRAIFTGHHANPLLPRLSRSTEICYHALMADTEFYAQTSGSASTCEPACRVESPSRLCCFPLGCPRVEPTCQPAGLMPFQPRPRACEPPRPSRPPSRPRRCAKLLLRSTLSSCSFLLEQLPQLRPAAYNF